MLVFDLKSLLCNKANLSLLKGTELLCIKSNTAWYKILLYLWRQYGDLCIKLTVYIKKTHPSLKKKGSKFIWNISNWYFTLWFMFGNYLKVQKIYKCYDYVNSFIWISLFTNENLLYLKKHCFPSNNVTTFFFYIFNPHVLLILKIYM